MPSFPICIPSRSVSCLIALTGAPSAVLKRNEGSEQSYLVPYQSEIVLCFSLPRKSVSDISGIYGSLIRNLT